MKNFTKFTGIAAIVAIAAIGMMFAGCGQDDENQSGGAATAKTLLITGLDAYNGKSANVALSLLNAEKAYGEAAISGGNAVLSLKDTASGQPFTGKGMYTITLTIDDDKSYTAAKTIITSSTAMAFTEFTAIPDPTQKKITITGIPAEHNSKAIALELLQLQGGAQKAAGSGTISGASVTVSLTFDNQPFTGSGLYTVRFTLDNSAQVHYEALLPRAITAETTTLPWSDFSLKATTP